MSLSFDIQINDYQKQVVVSFKYRHLEYMYHLWFGRKHTNMLCHQ